MIRNQQPAYQYGLSLLGNQQGPNQAGVAGGIDRAIQPIIAALLMKQGIKQQKAEDAKYSDALLGFQQNVQNELVPTGINATPPVQMGEDPSLRDYSGVVQKRGVGDAMSAALMHSKNPEFINSMGPMVMQRQADDASMADQRGMEMGRALMGERFARGRQNDQQQFAAGQQAEQLAATSANAEATRQAEMDRANRPLTDAQLAQQTQLRAAGRPVTNVNTNMPPQQKKFDEKVGEIQGERYGQIVKNADNARAKVQMLQTLGPALADAPFAGPGAETLTNATMLAKQLGISSADTSGAELARSLSNQMTMMNRNPSGGAGMPGAMSDADRDFLKSTVPGLANTRGGAQKMVELQMKVEQRNVEIADLAQQYIEQNGKLDSGFDKAVKAYADAHPLFAPAATSAQPNIDALLKKYQ